MMTTRSDEQDTERGLCIRRGVLRGRSSILPDEVPVRRTAKTYRLWRGVRSARQSRPPASWGDDADHAAPRVADRGLRRTIGAMCSAPAEGSLREAQPAENVAAPASRGASPRDRSPRSGPVVGEPEPRVVPPHGCSPPTRGRAIRPERCVSTLGDAARATLARPPPHQVVLWERNVRQPGAGSAPGTCARAGARRARRRKVGFVPRALRVAASEPVFAQPALKASRDPVRWECAPRRA